MNDERRNQVTETNKGKQIWQKIGFICLAVVVAFFTILVINL